MHGFGVGGNDDFLILFSPTDIHTYGMIADIRLGLAFTLMCTLPCSDAFIERDAADIQIHGWPKRNTIC